MPSVRCCRSPCVIRAIPSNKFFFFLSFSEIKNYNESRLTTHGLTFTVVDGFFSMRKRLEVSRLE